MTRQSVLIKAIAEDVQKRHPDYHQSRREGLAALAGVMLEVRSANMMALATGLPRAIGTAHDRSPYIARQLTNAKTAVDVTIQPYALEVIQRLAARGETLVVPMDQRHINAVHEVLMLSVRLRKRAVPVAWRVRSTQGNIGIGVQQELLHSVKAWVPDGIAILWAADRFAGTASLIDWCQQAGWSYRRRLQGHLPLTHEGGALTTGDGAARIPAGVLDAELSGSGVTTNSGTRHEKGQKEPWIIAMDVKPSRDTVLDDGMRWGIENLCSDCKSRGFGLMQSPIQKPERLARLILVMSIALYWAVSCGAFAEHHAATSGLQRGL